MKKMAAGLERFLALGCGLAALLSLGSLFEGGSPAALVLAAALLAAARGLSLLAERSERAALRARRRRQRTTQRRAHRLSLIHIFKTPEELARERAEKSQ